MWIVSILVLLGFGAAVAADDGPAADLRAIYSAAPVLLPERVRDDQISGTPTIDGVVVVGDHALLQWHIGGAVQIETMVRQYGVWWLESPIWLNPRDGSAMCCGGYYSPADADGPTPRFLKSLHVPSDVVDLAATHLSSVAVAKRRSAARPKGFDSHFHGDGYIVDSIGFGAAPSTPWPAGGYDPSFWFSPNDAASDARLTEFRGRWPTLAESWERQPGSGSYYFFEASVSSKETIHVTAGTRIDVWFPFVVNPTVDYFLALANTADPMGAVRGRLRSSTNVVSFVLPAFSLAPQATVQGQIFGAKNHAPSCPLI